MHLRYLGTGTILIPGFGEVSSGDVLGVTDELGQALLEQQPGHFEVAGAEPAPPAREPGHFAGPRLRQRGGD